MKTVNMHEAKTHLSRLVREAAAGEPFVIAIRGKPMVMVTALEPGDLATVTKGRQAADMRDNQSRVGAARMPARQKTGRSLGKT